MAPQSVQDNKMSSIFSKDSKPRLKWTAELHQIFVDAVGQLGGAEKATPKSLMRVMNIHGLSLFHLKSHLQKYRHGKSNQSLRDCNKKKQRDYKSQIHAERCDDAMQKQRNVQIAEALEVQMEVQRKIHEQIEVQRHLQLRIEAQGKYLHSALKKAQEILSKAELSLLISPLMVDLGCHSSSESGLTTDETLKSSGISRYDETLKSCAGILENLDLSLQNKFDDTTECKTIDLNREWKLETL